jgi:L-seryl-tRNA(Ser) seleniumtransferase
MLSSMKNKNPLRALPSVDYLLKHPVWATLPEEIPHPVLVQAARDVLRQCRERIQEGSEGMTEEEILLEIASLVHKRLQPSLTYAINATGVVLSTNLGRAVLSDAALLALVNVMGGHATLEINRETGRRGSRQVHVRNLLCELTGAEDALVVNNNAAAVYLCMHVLAAGREVIISRGQLVEIGGAFRMPDIIRQSGATLVEVGTTNRTRLQDYADAIRPETALILRCHPSNFKIIGFTEEAPLSELTALGQEKGIPVMDDVGSGCLLNTRTLGLPYEPTIIESLQAGCDIVTGSGDKLLGGPQAGLILGKSEPVERIRKHPLMRVLRPDKLTLAALEATLRLYLDPHQAVKSIPTWCYLLRTPETLQKLANRLKRLLKKRAVGSGWEFTVVPTLAEIGGGSMPGETLPSYAVALRHNHLQTEETARLLRVNDPPIFTRVEGGQVLIDMRTIEEEELEIIADAVGNQCV